MNGQQETSITVGIREDHTNWLPNTKWSAPKTNMQTMLCILNLLYLGICSLAENSHTHIYITIYV